MLKHIRDLNCADVERQTSSVQSLRKLANNGQAAAIGEHAKALCEKIQSTDPNIRSGMLDILRVLVDEREVGFVFTYLPTIAACLKDVDFSIQRRAAAFCRSLAESDQATLLVRWIPEIVKAFESTQLLAPLEALTALAENGEAHAVALVDPLCITKALSHGSASISIGGCQLLIALGRAGYSNPVRNKNVLGALVQLLQKDSNDIKIASSQVLESVSWDEIRDVRDGKHASTLLEIMHRAFHSCDELFQSLANALGRQDFALKHRKGKDLEQKLDEELANSDGVLNRPDTASKDVSWNAESEPYSPLSRLSPLSSSVSIARLRALTRNLKDFKLETRINAARDWSLAIDSADVACEAAQHIDAFRNVLAEKSIEARRASMAAICGILSHGKAFVGCAELVVSCLSDADVVVQRRAAISCKLLAERGSSDTLLPHLNAIILSFGQSSECAESLLQALSAMARSGHVVIVARKVFHSSLALEKLAKLVQSGRAGLDAATLIRDIVKQDLNCLHAVRGRKLLRVAVLTACVNWTDLDLSEVCGSAVGLPAGVLRLLKTY